MVSNVSIVRRSFYSLKYPRDHQQDWEQLLFVGATLPPLQGDQQESKKEFQKLVLFETK